VVIATIGLIGKKDGHQNEADVVVAGAGTK